MPVVVEKDACIGCSACVSVCPVSVIVMNDEGKAVIEDGCIDCLTCIGACPTGAIASE